MYMAFLNVAPSLTKVIINQILLETENDKSKHTPKTKKIHTKNMCEDKSDFKIKMLNNKVKAS